MRSRLSPLIAAGALEGNREAHCIFRRHLRASRRRAQRPVQQRDQALVRSCGGCRGPGPCNVGGSRGNAVFHPGSGGRSWRRQGYRGQQGAAKARGTGRTGSAAPCLRRTGAAVVHADLGLRSVFHCDAHLAQTRPGPGPGGAARGRGQHAQRGAVRRAVLVLRQAHARTGNTSGALGGRIREQTRWPVRAVARPEPAASHPGSGDYLCPADARSSSALWRHRCQGQQHPPDPGAGGDAVPVDRDR